MEEMLTLRQSLDICGHDDLPTGKRSDTFSHLSTSHTYATVIRATAAAAGASSIIRSPCCFSSDPKRPPGTPASFRQSAASPTAVVAEKNEEDPLALFTRWLPSDFFFFSSRNLAFDCSCSTHRKTHPVKAFLHNPLLDHDKHFLLPRVGWVVETPHRHWRQ